MDWDWDVSTESLSVMVEICEQFVAEGGEKVGENLTYLDLYKFDREKRTENK